LQLAPLIDWNEMKIGMQQKFSDVEVDELGMKMDVVKREPQHQIQVYLAQLNKLFKNGKIKDDEQRKRLFAYL
jgi:hypothetical protein